MQFRRVLVSGGAGFVGSSLAIALKAAFPEVSVTALDNLRRRGSELNLPRLKRHGVVFLHGDVRCREDIEVCSAFDLLVDCSAEPSVQAGLDGACLSVVSNNLFGTVVCMEAARRHEAAFLFVSSSRVYPVGRLNALAFREEPTRFCWTGEDGVPGASAAGIAEEFPLESSRSLYGATKLAGELLLQECAASFGMPVLIDRCGVLAGPWQMGKADQGVVTLWVARHIFRQDLAYFGYGGSGKQVRDVLHVDDFIDLVCRQLERPSLWDGRAYNVGGGPSSSASLVELTEICRAATGCRAAIHRREEPSPADLRIYISDCRRAAADFQWRPRPAVDHIVEDIAAWVRANEGVLREILA